MSCGIKESIVFTMGLVTGTGTTLTGKILYGISSYGMDGTVKKFEKPIFQTWLMFLAMIIALPIQSLYHYHVERKWKKSNPTFYGKNNKKNKNNNIPMKTYFFLLIPAAFDLVATFLANVGLLYVTVSVFQLMKCTVIIFVALLKALLFKDKLHSYMWFGIILNTLAVLLVGLTSFFDSNSETEANTQHNISQSEAFPGVGILFIIASCLVQSCQYVFEEKLMENTDDNEIIAPPPLIVVGMEGFWGFLLTTFIIYPIAYLLPGTDYNGSHESFTDAIEMIMNSNLIFMIIILYILLILGYNIFAVSVTYLLNSIWHAILDNFRPITVWGTDLLLYYIFTNKMFGEKWTIHSYLQLGGMILLLVGTAVYNGTIKVRGFIYKDLEIEQEKKSEQTIDGSVGLTPTNLASTSFTRSPIILRNARKAAEIVGKTPDIMEQKRIRREFMTEYQPLGSSSSTFNGTNNNNNNIKNRKKELGKIKTYGSMEV